MMGWGVTCLLRISTYVTELPAALWRMPAPSFMAVVVMMAGVYHMLVAKSKFRWLGMVPIIMACIWMMSLSSPDMMLTQGRVLIAPDPHSKDLFIEGKVDRFQKTLLLQRTGKEIIKPFPCAGDICDLVIAKQKLRIVRTVEALPQACDKAPPLIVTRYYLDKKCADVVVVDRHNLDRQGGFALWLDKRIRLETVLSPHANRPWQQRAVKKDWNFGKYKARLKPEKETP